MPSPVTGFVQDAASEFVCDDGRDGYRAVVLCVAYCGFETRHEALAFVAAKYAQLAYEERAAFYADQRRRLHASPEDER